MMKHWPTNVRPNGNAIKAAIISAILVAAFSGGFVAQIIGFTLGPIIRPDPFTGAEGREHERRLDELEKRVQELEIAGDS
jgi:hypothetical protein